MATLMIPFPPSVNRLWRQFRGRTIVSAEGRAYRKEVEATLWGNGWHETEEFLKVSIDAYMPDNRKRDLDNLLKASLDGLTAAGIWKDDSQIRQLSIRHCGVDKGHARLVVTLEEMG